MTVLNSGYAIRRFQEILKETGDDIQDNFSGGIGLSSDELVGVLYNLVTRGQSYVWELSQGVYDSIGLYTAEGEMLENAALLVGFVRLPATKTRGEVLVTAKSGTTIPKGSTFSSVIGDTFEAVQEQIISPSFCRGFQLSVNTVQSNTLYSIAVNNNQYTYTSSGAATAEEILLEFQSLLGIEGTLTVEYKEDVPTEPYLLVTVDGVSSEAFSGSTFFTFDYVKTRVLVAASVAGTIPAKVGMINTLVSPELDTVYSVSNLYDFPEGSSPESDYALRRRVINAYKLIAGGTPDSVHAGVSEVSGVISAKVTENRGLTTLPSGQPPKSFRTVVYGGNSLDVAKAIWENKAAGTHTWTDRTNTERGVVQEVLDYNEQSHYVQFTRPSVKYIWVKIDYTKYSEEAFTSGGEEIMKEVVVSTGDQLGIGNDVIPKRFVGPIYKQVNGIQDLDITMAITDDTLTPPLPGDYVSVRLPISDEEITNFSVARIEVFDITP